MFFFFQAEDGIRDWSVTGVQTCALPISGINASAMTISDKGRRTAPARASHSGRPKSTRDLRGPFRSAHVAAPAARKTPETSKRAINRMTVIGSPQNTLRLLHGFLNSEKPAARKSVSFRTSARAIFLVSNTGVI